MHKPPLAPKSLLLACGLIVSAVSAQSAPGSAAQSRVIEEVIVTAEHRQSSLQDTQISLTAFSEQKIADLGLSNASDIGSYTPNLTISPQIGGRNGFAVNIRGVRNGETLISFEPAVGLYLDGVLIAKNSGALLDVADPERIEVLRGPQGTLYGRNTIGGAINVVTKKPSDELEARLSLTAGSYSQRDIKGMLNLPLLSDSSPIGALNLRLVGANYERDGFYDNTFAGAESSEVQDRNRDVALVHLEWRPDERFSARYSYDRTEIDEIPLPSFVTVIDENHATGADLEPYRVKQGKRPEEGSWDGRMFGISDVEGHALNLSVELGESLSLTSISSLRTVEIDGGGDADGAPIHRFHTLDFSTSETFTQEFRLLGEALNSRLSYVVGAYYLDEDGEQDNFINPYVAAAPGVFVFFERTDSADFDVQARALYAQATYNLSDSWDVTAGVRYTEEDRAMSKVRTDILRQPLLGLPLTTTLTHYPETERSFTNVSPMASTSYHWNDQVMAYFKVSQGYQSGGFNSRDADARDFARGFDEETLTAYEIGWKATFADQRIRLNGAVFHSDYADKQVNAFNQETAASVIRNAGVVEIRGLELEFVTLLTDSLEAGLDYGYTDPEYVEYDNGQGSDLTNSNFPYTPKHNAHAFLVYDQPLPFAHFTARLDWSYQDEMTFLTPAPETNSGDSYQLWSARISLSDMSGFGDSRVRVSLWGKNLADEEYWNFGVDLFSFFGYAINSYGDPRTYGVDLEIEF